MWQIENLERKIWLSFLNCLHSKITRSLLRYQRIEWVGLWAWLHFNVGFWVWYNVAISRYHFRKFFVDGQVFLSKASSQITDDKFVCPRKALSSWTICKFLVYYCLFKRLLDHVLGVTTDDAIHRGNKKGRVPGVSLSPVYRNLIMKQPLRMQSYLHC